MFREFLKQFRVLDVSEAYSSECVSWDEYVEEFNETKSLVALTRRNQLNEYTRLNSEDVLFYCFERHIITTTPLVYTFYTTQGSFNQDSEDIQFHSRRLPIY